MSARLAPASDPTPGAEIGAPLAERGRPTQLLFLMPVYNDWPSATVVVERLNAVLDGSLHRAHVLLVDDGSSLAADPVVLGPSSPIERVEALRLRRNLGHQRAICVGLAWVESHREADCVIVMDADGEDDPADVPRLLARWEDAGRARVVFAERRRRSEGGVFRISYAAYRLVHRVLTGRAVRVGNFSVLPFRALRTLVVVSELWSHYAAAVFVSGIQYTMLPTARGVRVTGRSSMNFPSLVVHGLSAISVFADVAGVRLLIASIVAAVMAGVGISIVVWIRLFTTSAVPGWATYTTGILFIVLLQAIMLAFGLSFTMAANRKGASFLPARDYAFFVDRVEVVCSAPSLAQTSTEVW